ncbi:MAG: hypothetical protein ACFBRM_14985 [Pikeienuella sp.]
MATLGLSACGFSSGKEIDALALRQLEVGTTTYTDVVSQFGAPTGETVLQDGSRTATYSSGSGNVFSGMSTNVVIMNFDSDLVFQGFTQSRSTF